MYWNFGIRLLAMLMAFSTYAHAQQPAASGRAVTPVAAKLPANADPLEVKLVRSKVVIVDGKETLQSAEIAKPGEILEEVVTYSNKSKALLKRLEATLPIPANTELMMASVKPGNGKASIDGRQFFPLPLKRRLKQANGLDIEQLVPLSEYRYLRWYPGDLAADSSLIFSARFKLSNESAPAASPASK